MRFSMPITLLTHSHALRGRDFFQGLNSPSMALVSQIALIASILVLCLGCGKPQVPVAPQPAPPATASVETGTVKIEFDMPVDPLAVVTIAGSRYSPKD